ncbi:hypothetical protein N0V90_011475 [Kalmusia sp. IMI 367209]|nr:hypothetical protein N0V90_011475 [Kalmusia sp. IMI 367209]
MTFHAVVGPEATALADAQKTPRGALLSDAIRFSDRSSAAGPASLCRPPSTIDELRADPNMVLAQGK